MLAGYYFAETSPAAAGTVASSGFVTGSTTAGIAWPLDQYQAVDAIAEFAGATGGSLDVYIQSSPDGGNNWFDIAHFAQAAGSSAYTVYRVSLNAAGTAPVVVGKDLSPALAAASAVGAFCDQVRLVMVAGSGTSAGTRVTVTLCAQRPRVSV